MKKDKIKSLLKMPAMALITKANRIREKFSGRQLDLCTIMNAKSGHCSEDCKFCAQSSRHSAVLEAYPLRAKEKIVLSALQAKEAGAARFGIVTSGDRLSEKDFQVIADAVKEISQQVRIGVCASLGNMDQGQFKLLKKCGLSRYHHNIETSERFFPKIVSTHSFQDRVKTIKAAKKCGLEVCSGGIIGMGEGMADRIAMALKLKELSVDSVPINILIPIEGTALAGQPLLSAEEALKTIAIFRIILKDKTIKIAAGRESVLKDFQALAFMSGANGMLIGGYLTVRGRAAAEDRKLCEEIKKLWK